MEEAKEVKEMKGKRFPSVCARTIFPFLHFPYFLHLLYFLSSEPETNDH
jgi:hypothetical protein